MAESDIVLPELSLASQLPLVSVVVPTYQRELLLCNVLRSLLGQTYPHLEIIVVDQTEEHEESTRHFLDRNRRHLRLIRSAPPAVTHARSAGAMAARGDIVLYVDDDVVCSPGLVAAHVRAHQVARVGVVAGRVTDVRDPSVIDNARVGRLEPSSAGVTRFFASPVRQFVHHAYGPNMSFKRPLLLRAGLVEPAFDGTARYEETDTCIRVARLGYKVLFEPTAHVHHLGGPGGQSYGVGFDRAYRSTVHNALLFTWRNLRHRYWLPVLLYRLRNALYHARRDRAWLPVRIFFEEAPRSVVSYFRSTGSLPKGAPRWPVT
jgi:GT2 family glycosyltransferase